MDALQDHEYVQVLSSLKANKHFQQLFPSPNPKKGYFSFTTRAKFPVIVSHVATYVLTENGEIVFQAKRKGAQAMGGCNYPNCIPRMINSLRLELMDEGGLLLDESTCLAMSPLFLIQGLTKNDITLVQVVKIADGVAKTMWSPEAARNKLGHTHVPDDIVLTCSNGREKYRAGNIIEKDSLEEAIKIRWRSFDGNTLSVLQNAGVFSQMMAPTPWEENKIVVLPTKSGIVISEDLQKLVDCCNHEDLEPLRDIAQRPWTPVLWKDANILQNLQTIPDI
eukprot:m.5386 g.5386  ORF g.5386 m.5386 type:complete len:279 (+) comp3290_c0_seq2:187-1023(+)